MREVAVFDTHRFVKNLSQNGFTERQAEVLAREQVTLLTTQLATKADIESLKAATKADIGTVKVTTKAEIEKLRLKMEERLATQKADLLKWGIGALIAQSGLIIAIIRWL